MIASDVLADAQRWLDSIATRTHPLAAVNAAIAVIEDAVSEILDLRAAATLRPLDEYHEDFGTVLWWRLPITEPPYVGSTLDIDFPDDVTHWSRLPIPRGAK